MLLARVILPIWVAQAGPQTLATNSKARVIGYGGAAGGGKTDLIAGFSLTQHKRSLILRHEGTQLKALEDRLKELIWSYPPFAKASFNDVKHIWSRLPDKRLIQLGGIPNLGDEKKYQGQPHDLKAFDEATEIAKRQAQFVSGWTRSADPIQVLRNLYTFNPPTTVEGRWIIGFFAPWLDLKHPHPAGHGEIRYFTTIDGEEIECEAEPFFHKGKLIRPVSRTFIFAKTSDNAYYAGGEYESVLQALPEPLRSQMLNGDFLAGIEDDERQVIPTEWVMLAQERWKARNKPDMPMSAMGVDVARGGKDKTVIACRYGNWFAPLIKKPGATTPNGPETARFVIEALQEDPEHLPVINVDVIGYGASAYDSLIGQGIEAIPVNVAEASEESDKTKRLGFVNLRAEIIWKFREALDPVHGEDLALPDDPELLADLTAPRWELQSNGILIEGKPELKKRIGRSPDCADAVVLAHYMSRGRSILDFYREQFMKAQEEGKK